MNNKYILATDSHFTILAVIAQLIRESYDFRYEYSSSSLIIDVPLARRSEFVDLCNNNKVTANFYSDATLPKSGN